MRIWLVKSSFPNPRTNLGIYTLKLGDFVVSFQTLIDWKSLKSQFCWPPKPMFSQRLLLLFLPVEAARHRILPRHQNCKSEIFSGQVIFFNHPIFKWFIRIFIMHFPTGVSLEGHQTAVRAFLVGRSHSGPHARRPPETTREMVGHWWDLGRFYTNVII